MVQIYESEIIWNCVKSCTILFYHTLFSGILQRLSFDMYFWHLNTCMNRCNFFVTMFWSIKVFKYHCYNKRNVLECDFVIIICTVNRWIKWWYQVLISKHSVIVLFLSSSRLQNVDISKIFNCIKVFCKQQIYKTLKFAIFYCPQSISNSTSILLHLYHTIVSFLDSDFNVVTTTRLHTPSCCTHI